MNHADSHHATVREHKSKHDRLAELPLITESARVTRVTAMDRDRRAEAFTAVERWLADCGVADRYDAPRSVDGLTRLRTALARDGHADLSRRVATLAERCERPKPMLVSVELHPDERVDYLAGQYVGLRYDGTSRAYSLSSSPNREALELCVRRNPGGRLSPSICEDLAVGDEVTVRGPYGDLVLADPSPRDLVFLATGTGVAPFKGMIDYVFEEGLDEYRGETRDVWLFLGAAWEDDLPYREAFRERQRTRPNFHFVPCLSRESVLTGWDGETDYVQHALLKHTDSAAVTAPLDERLETWLGREPESGVDARIDPGNAEVYACGINAMVHSLVTAAEHVGVPTECIESEGFG